MDYVKIDGRTAQVAIAGRYDLCITPKVTEEIKSALRSGCTSVVFDMKDVYYIDSAAVKDMVEIFRDELGRKNFRVENTTGNVKELFEAMNLDSIWGI